MVILKNKRGFIRILEAFIAILLITGVILVVLDRGYFERTDITAQIYDTEVSILREIELDNSLREQVLEVSQENLPLKWSSQDFPSQVKERIIQRTPDYLECSANICELVDICGLENYVEVDVYVQSVAITANLELYRPRQLKLFCWTK